MPHIKIPDVEPVIRILANGTDKVFSYGFPVFASEDLAVYINGARQSGGYAVNGAGDTAGGNVVFDNAPANGSIVMLARELQIERVSDYLEGGDFSAASINNELDYLVAALQQVQRGVSHSLSFPQGENANQTSLPDKALRANKALGFDNDGHPVALEIVAGAGEGGEFSSGSGEFTASGTGALARPVTSKLSDMVSVKDFGAKGDGLSDDTVAIQNAMAAHDAVFIPPGIYVISSPLAMRAGQSLIGAGHSAVIKAGSNAFNAIEIPCGYTVLSHMKIEGGQIGVKIFGHQSEAVQNALSDLHIKGADTGIVLDGYNDTQKPCYWNNFARILIEAPNVNGILLTRSGAGDTPNANRFNAVRVFSKGAPTSGSGFYIEHGKLNNSFTDCEANINGATAHSCFRIGAGASDTLIANLLTEGNNVLTNLKLENGSSATTVVNLSAQSNGAAIHDLSGGDYIAINAGYPDKNTLRRTRITDLKVDSLRYTTEYISAAGAHNLDLSHSVHLVGASSGAVDLVLPNASGVAEGAEFTIKKIDMSENAVSITEASGAGLGAGVDRKTLRLSKHGDFVTIMSNGAEWFITSTNQARRTTRYYDGTGVYDVVGDCDIYLLSSYSGALSVRLPPADAEDVIDRPITIKKTDVSANEITITELGGGGGPDQSSPVLSVCYDTITVISNGAQWYILGRYP